MSIQVLFLSKNELDTIRAKWGLYAPSVDHTRPVETIRAKSILLHRGLRVSIQVLFLSKNEFDTIRAKWGPYAPSDAHTRQV